MFDIFLICLLLLSHIDVLLFPYTPCMAYIYILYIYMHIYAYIDPPNHPNVGIYGIHGASGVDSWHGLVAAESDFTNGTLGALEPLSAFWASTSSPRHHKWSS